MTNTSVCVGSHPAVPATSVTVTANAIQEVLSFGGGAYYLQSSTGSLSLVAAVVTMLNTHTELLGSAAFITSSGRVRITNATAFSVDSWGSSLTLRNLLGFSAALVSATAHVAPLVSPLYWAPGKTETPTARLGSDGLLTKDTRAARSAPGRVVATTNNTWRRNGLMWRRLLVDRVEQVPDVNGTFATFWDDVLSPRRRFYVGREVVEDLADTTTAMDLSTRIPSTQPYIWRNEGPDERPHDRELRFLEKFVSVDVQVETAVEYS